MARVESTMKVPMADGTDYTYILREDIVPEDIVMSLGRAAGYFKRAGKEYAAERVEEPVKDLMINTLVSI